MILKIRQCLLRTVVIYIRGTAEFPFQKDGLAIYFKVQFTCSQGTVAQSLDSANRWLRALRGIKTNMFPWYFTLISANHASSNPGLRHFSRKSRKLFGPEKPFEKLPTACFGKAIF